MIDIYEPKVTYAVVNDIFPEWSPRMGYNHDSDITFFEGRYLCIWNATRDSAEWGGKHEGAPEQLNYISESRDFQTWSTPRPAFTSAGGAVNPVDVGPQWQPNFINYRGERLFVNWCTTNLGHANGNYVSASENGLHWENQLQPSIPHELIEQAEALRRLPRPEKGHALRRTTPLAFPTQHGLVTHNGVMLFPNSLVPWQLSRYTAALRSEDGGRTWHWGSPTPPLPLREIGTSIEPIPDQAYTWVWEPMYFERQDGTVSAVIRSGVMDPEIRGKVRIPPEHMILCAESRDQGRTWGTLRPIQVESVSSRCLILSGTTSPDGLFMVMNDSRNGEPSGILDRYNLSLYVAPVSEPDLLLPGPIVQAEGNIAHYPNGEVRDGTLIFSYSFGHHPRAIRASSVSPLPDFSESFLLPRGGRPAVRIEANTAYFPETYSSLGLVLTEELTVKESLHLRFRAKVLNVPMAFGRTPGRFSPLESVPLLTVGGKTRNGTCLRVVYTEGPTSALECWVDNMWVRLGDIAYDRWHEVDLRINSSTFKVSLDGTDERTFSARLLRKVSFGGLYFEPTRHTTTGNFLLDLDSILVE